MSGPAPRSVFISKMERRRLWKITGQRRAAVALVHRVKMVLFLSAGHGPTEVGKMLLVSDRVVRKWRARWEQSPRLEALDDAPRSGRPPRIDLATRCEVVKLACERVADCRTPFETIWSQQRLADALDRTCKVRISRSSVQRILSVRGLRPHRVRQWLHSPDPNFQEKVRRVCDLYTKPPKGTVLLCVDEKPIQILRRKHPTRVGPKAVRRREYEYIRGGICQLLAAFEVGTGKIHGRIVKHRDAKTMTAFLDSVVAQYPGRKIIVIWDNLNLHYDGRDGRWSKLSDRFGGCIEFVHTPLHASWVNQVEIWFSILQRRVIRYGSFDDLNDVRTAVLGFIRHWNAVLFRPFRWTFSGNFDQSPRAA